MEILKIDRTKYLNVNEIETIDILERPTGIQIRFQLKTKPVTMSRVFATLEEAEQFITSNFTLKSGTITLFEVEAEKETKNSKVKK